MESTFKGVACFYYAMPAKRKKQDLHDKHQGPLIT